MNDVVNHPSHYTSGSIECIDAIESALTQEEFEGFLHGNIIKYDWRYRIKNGVEDLKKSQWYNNKLVSFIQSAKYHVKSKISEINIIKTCQYKSGEFPRINDIILGEDNKLWVVNKINIDNYPYILSCKKAREYNESSTNDYELKDLKPQWMTTFDRYRIYHENKS